ncbi:MAG TPA: YfhO family protein, partial [Chloroflexota bacterium]|nr:YfhO family protein [Chloroflexota bacterium]
GWQVWVDGHRATVRKADYLLRAVQVPPGRHLITFVYAPLSYLAGMVLTLATGLFVVGVLIWTVLARQKPRRDGASHGQGSWGQLASER